MTTVAETPLPSKKRIRLIALLTLLIALSLLLGFVAYYLVNFAPSASGNSGPPRYAKSIYGTAGAGALNQPMGIALDKKGNLYTVDSTNQRIQVFTPDGSVLARFPREKSKLKLVNPLYIAVSPVTNEVYVSDRGVGKVFVFSSNGRYLREFKPLGRSFTWGPVALAFDRDGLFYVSDFGSQQIRVFETDGTLVRTLGKSGEDFGEFQFPNGIAIDSDNIYIADSNNGRIQVFDILGKPLREFPAGSLPRGVAIDNKGRLFVVDTFEHMVRVYDAKDGRQLFTFGGLGQGEGQFLFPNTIAIHNNSKLYVTDRDNNRITEWVYDQ